jgi:serine/threonine-protein kinase
MIVGGAGIAAVGIGGILGIAALSQTNGNGMPAAVTLVTGGLLTAGGAALYFTAPSASSRVGVSPSIGPNAQGIQVFGTF